MSLESLLKQAMELEKMQAKLYEGLAKKFYFSEEISRFWSDMAEDEKDHYERIVKMHNELAAEQLSAEIDSDLYDAVCKGLSELKLSRLEKIFDLHDACELAAEVETYETEAVFKFVHARFKNDSRHLEVCGSILAHLDKLAKFSDRCGSIDEKRRIKVIP
jgi:rubrerythrin